MVGGTRAAQRLEVVEGGAEPEATPESDLTRHVEEAATGNAAAVARVLRRVGPHVARTVAAVLGPTDPELEDVTQDALVALIGALPAFRGDASPRWFATRVASKVAMTALRRRSRQRALDLAMQSADKHSPARARRIVLLRRALASIPAAQAEAIALRWMLGHSLAEVAEITGVPSNTVRSRIRLAREALVERLRTSHVWADVLRSEYGGPS